MLRSPPPTPSPFRLCLFMRPPRAYNIESTTHSHRMTSSHPLLSAILIHSSKLFSIFLISFFLNLSLTHSFTPSYTPAYLHHFHFLSLPTPPQPSSPSILASLSFLKGERTWLWNMCRKCGFPPRWESLVGGRSRRGRGGGEEILCYHSPPFSLSPGWDDVWLQRPHVGRVMD